MPLFKYFILDTFKKAEKKSEKLRDVSAIDIESSEAESGSTSARENNSQPPPALNLGNLNLINVFS